MKIIGMGMFPCNITTFKGKVKMTFRNARRGKGIGENNVLIGTHTDEEITGLGVELSEKAVQRFILSGRGPRSIGRKRQP
jgi:hypothetical protein